MSDDRELAWVQLDYGECPCAVDIGPHLHSIRPDGTFGNIVRPVEDHEGEA